MRKLGGDALALTFAYPVAPSDHTPSRPPLPSKIVRRNCRDASGRGLISMLKGLDVELMLWIAR